MATIKSYRSKGKTKYMFKVYLGTDPSTGKRIDTTRRGFSSAREAKQALTQLKAEYDTGKFKTKNQDITLGELFKMWWLVYEPSVKMTTANNKYRHYQNHFEQYNNLKVSKLTTLWAQDVVNELASEYKSYKSILAALKLVIGYGLRLELIEKDPFALVIYPKELESSKKVTKIKNNFYSKPELNLFLSRAKAAANPVFYPFFRLLAYSGIRSGEIMALTWNDLDFTENKLSISKTVVHDATRGVNLITNPKTKKSTRVIFLDEETMCALKDWKTIQARWLLSKGINALSGAQLIFPKRNNELAGTTLANSRLYTFYRQNPDLRRITIHGFRHTHATLLLEAGLNVKDVQERLGHKNIQITLDTYSHVTQQKKQETVTKFANYLES